MAKKGSYPGGVVGVEMVMFTDVPLAARGGEKEPPPVIARAPKKLICAALLGAPRLPSWGRLSEFALYAGDARFSPDVNFVVRCLEPLALLVLRSSTTQDGA